jgi:hypothetical protein
MTDYYTVCSNPTSATDVDCLTGTKLLYPAPVPFDPSELDPVTLMECFAGGFSIVGAAMLIIFGFKTIIYPFLPKKR